VLTLPLAARGGYTLDGLPRTRAAGIAAAEPRQPQGVLYGAPITEETAEQWQQAAPARADSWWPHYAHWLASRSGGERDTPDARGGMTLAPLDPAPGTYVFGR
jgi:poly(3-hydroxyalkanoate) synthetase